MVPSKHQLKTDQIKSDLLNTNKLLKTLIKKERIANAKRERKTYINN